MSTSKCGWYNKEEKALVWWGWNICIFSTLNGIPYRFSVIIHHTIDARYRSLCISNGQNCFADLCTVISIKAFFLAAYQACFLTFVSVFRRSVSDPFPYLSCRPCLPLSLSFSCWSSAISVWGYNVLPALVSAINLINQDSLYSPCIPTFEICRNLRFLSSPLLLINWFNLIPKGGVKWRLTINYIPGY